MIILPVRLHDGNKKINDNYGNFCRFSLKNYDYYEYFFQKMIIENRPQ